MNTIHILVFEDDTAYFEGLQTRLNGLAARYAERFHFVFTRSRDGIEWRRISPPGSTGSSISDADLLDERCDVIILDMNLSGERDRISTGLAVLSRLEKLEGGCRNICINTAHGEILRSDHWSEFENMLNGRLCDRIALWEKPSHEPLIAHIVALLEARASGIRLPAGLISYIRGLSHTDDSVLLLGPTGVGKEEVAWSIHRSWAAAHPNSREVENNFVRLNCANLTEELGRGELFGVVAGSYTGAEVHSLGTVLRAAGVKGSRTRDARVKGSQGYFEWFKAQNPNCVTDSAIFDIEVPLFGESHRARGTLFLDEVGAMPVASQRGLLRFLNDWEIAPVGFEGVVHTSKRQPLVRVIAATNDPRWINQAKGLIAESPECPDLLYRLARNILFVTPPQPSEVDGLVELEKRDLGATDIAWSSDALNELRDWVRDGRIRGHRREIRAIARRAMLLVRGAEVGIPVADTSCVTKRELLMACRPPGELTEATPSAVFAAIAPISSPHQSPTFRTVTDDAESQPSRPVLIDVTWQTDNFGDLVKAIRNSFESMLRREEKHNFEDWLLCKSKLFSPQTVQRFDTAAKLEVWRRAILRAILDFDASDNLGRIFVDMPEKQNPRREWCWATLQALITEPEVFAYIKKAKESVAARQAVFQTVSKILADLGNPERRTDSLPAGTTTEQRLKAEQFARMLSLG